MDAKRSTSVPARRNRKPKKYSTAVEGRVADVMQKYAATAKIAPSQLALGPPMPLAIVRGKGKAKAKNRNYTLETTMEYIDVGDDPNVMRQKAHYYLAI